MTFSIDPIRNLSIDADFPRVTARMAAIYNNLTTDGATSVAINTQGLGYAVGDILELVIGGGTARVLCQIYIATIGGSGEALTAKVWKPGEYSVQSAGALATTNIAVAGTPDGACTATITYGANSTWTVEHETETTDTGVTAPTPNPSGTGTLYAPGNQLTVAGGTFAVAAVLNVDTVDGGGGITGLSVVERGSYSVDPADVTTNAVTGGDGSGAAVTLTMALNSEGPGSFSLSLLAPNGSTSVVYLNDSDNDDIPSRVTARVGTNPDSDVNPIVDSTAPWDSPNFSGASRLGMQAPWVDVSTYHTEFYYTEWSDAVSLLLKSAARAYFPSGFQAGRVYAPVLSHLADAGDTKHDGHGVIGSVPRLYTGTGNVFAWVGGHPSTRSCVRVAEGNAIGVNIELGWHYRLAGIYGDVSGVPSNPGPAGTTEVAWQVWAGIVNADNDLAVMGMFPLRYALAVTSRGANSEVIAGGETVAVVLSYNGSAASLCQPVIDDDPNLKFALNP